MQAEQCFAVAHKMDRKSIWPVCVGAWHTPVYPLVEHSGSEFPARSTVAFYLLLRELVDPPLVRGSSRLGY